MAEEIEVKDQDTVIGAPQGESGFSLNWTMADKLGIPVQMTLRAPASDDWYKLLRRRERVVALAVKSGFSTGRAQPPAAAETQQPPAAQPAAQPQSNLSMASFPASTLGQAAAPKPANGNGAQQAAQGGTGAMQSVIATRLIVQPQPDNRVTLEFYAEGHKFADVKVNKWPIARAASLLSSVTGQDLTVPVELDLTATTDPKIRVPGWRVWYRNGKEYQPGKFYKDVESVEAA